MAKKYETFKEYSNKPDTLYPSILKTLEICNFLITNQNELTYQIQGKIKRSWISWGEQYSISIIESKDNSQVYFSSKCKLPTQIIDWGKNRKNAILFYKTLDELLNSH